MASCTRNHGDIGMWFGTWHVEQITAGGAPTDVEGDIIEAATFASLPVRQQVRVIPVEGAAPKRTLWLLSRRDLSYSEVTITIAHSDGTFTREYIDLTGAFYLRM
jgi:hypothetical protein